MQVFAQIIGWIGALLVIAAYILVSLKKVDGESKIYQFMNFLGAVGVGINAFYQQAWPPFVIQVIWGIVAVFTLIRIKIKK